MAEITQLPTPVGPVQLVVVEVDDYAVNRPRHFSALLHFVARLRIHLILFRDRIRLLPGNGAGLLRVGAAPGECREDGQDCGRHCYQEYLSLQFSFLLPRNGTLRDDPSPDCRDRITQDRRQYKFDAAGRSTRLRISDIWCGTGNLREGLRDSAGRL